MTQAEILTHVRYLTKTSTADNVGDDASLLRILNDYVKRQFKELVNCNDDKFGVKATTHLNINPNQEDYALPSDCVKIKRVDITYDGSNWYPAEMVDDANYIDYALDATTIGERFNTKEPKVSLYGDNLYLRPIPETMVSNGLRLWYTQMPSLISSVSVGTIVTPSEYHGFLAYGVAAEVALRQGEMDLYNMMATQWENGLEKIRRTFAPRATGEELNFKEKPVNYA